MATIKISANELELLAERFGSQVRQIGHWNKTADGSLEVPMSNIAEAARSLDDKLPTGGSSTAVQFIEALAALNLKNFESKVLRYQGSNNPIETQRLRQEISRELFGR